MRVGINGFGRIGKNFLKALIARQPDIEVVGINDLSGAQDCAHLFHFDSTYGRFCGAVSADKDTLKIGERSIRVFAERDPSKLPWREHAVDIVVESTGLFVDAQKARAHIDGGGAKKVIISAPAKNEDITLVLGVNHTSYEPNKHHVISNASCTTNCLATAVKPLVDTFGWKQGFMTTVHAITNDQNVLDGPHKDIRRARGASFNIVPTSSGAAKALYLTIPEVEGSFDGFALRVPVATVSMCYLVAVLKKSATREALNQTLSEAANNGPLKGILDYSEAPLVSSDYRQSPFSATVDGLLTQAQGDLVQICAWYDNEWGYACRLADLVAMVANGSKKQMASQARP